MSRHDVDDDYLVVLDRALDAEARETDLVAELSAVWDVLGRVVYPYRTISPENQMPAISDAIRMVDEHGARSSRRSWRVDGTSTTTSSLSRASTVPSVS